jgi:hypothetical protein
LDGSDSAEKVYLAVRNAMQKCRNVQKCKRCLCVRRIVSDSVGFGRIGRERERVGSRCRRRSSGGEEIE